MKLASAIVTLLTSTFPVVTVAENCLLGAFSLELDGNCTAAKVLQAYAEQVYEVAGATPSSCTTSAADDLNAKLEDAGIEDASELCDRVYADQRKVPFASAANRGTDLQFEQMFFNGRTDWQEEVETLYQAENAAGEAEPLSATSILEEDAEQVDAFYEGDARGRRLEWPGELPNFQSSVKDADELATCTTNAAMCCWPKDRQARDNNGNCAKAYDENCVDKDPADNTNLCFVDVERGSNSTGEAGEGFFGFPGDDNNDGEGDIHCHGLAWSNDVNDHTARYKANNLFYVSMYDHIADLIKSSSGRKENTHTQPLKRISTLLLSGHRIIMRLFVATAFLSLHFAPKARAQQQCSGVSGPFTLTDITGHCTYDVLLEEYTSQVFDAMGSTCSENKLTAKEDFDAKLLATFTGAKTGVDAGAMLCKSLYDDATVVPFTNAADKGTDLHFEQLFYNGRGEWQEEVETLYEAKDADGNKVATSVLRKDASKVNEFYGNTAQYGRVSWPGEGENALPNFDNCPSHAAMCCWPKDRQARDNNGNCARPYDENCVDKDPADNTNLIFSDFAKGKKATGYDSPEGFAEFPGDDDNGEGPIHCHGFAWADDEYSSISRYKANNLFYVSMYDHMHQRGYVENIPGSPMCGCMDQMPLATRSDCTQVDVTEDWEVVFDGEDMTIHFTKVEVNFNACRGRNNRNNDLWAYAARLYDDGNMTAAQFGQVGRVLTNTNDEKHVNHAIEAAKATKGIVAGYNHDQDIWTMVAGRDEFEFSSPLGERAFRKAFLEQSLTKPSNLDIAFNKDANPSETPIMLRVCSSCIRSHKKIYYRRLTPVPSNIELLEDILQHRSKRTGNVWNTDFTLHSTYEDAKVGANAWKCPNNAFNYYAPFYGRCSPTGVQVNNQDSIFSDRNAVRLNVAYYVNKPESVGVKRFDPTLRGNVVTDVDIGHQPLKGHTFKDEDGTLHITSGGTDIWSQSDNFRYHSEPWEGDIDVKVHVTSFINTGGDWAKAGIMLRSDNSADSTYAFGTLFKSYGIGLQFRSSKGKAASSKNAYRTNPAQKSAWLRIVKKAENIEFYRMNGDEWNLQASATILFPMDKFRVGLAVTSQSHSKLAEATFEDYSVDNFKFPTAAPTLSDAPTLWEPLLEMDTQRTGTSYSSNGIDYLKGSGTGIWGSQDSFLYLNTLHANNDFSVEVYIKRFKYGYENSRGGIMIRDNNDPDAANAFVGAGGQYSGAVFQSRSVAGAKTDHHKMVWVNNDNTFWVKLVKVGSTVTGYYKKNGGEYTELGSVELTLTGSTVTVGKAATAGDSYSYAYSDTMQSTNYQIV
eukprot:CAMPEP_0196158876 /NCGR_PEP_ID=MMETSP0910-20130528/46036_1 /TAXON_ID=49265 /ORGANISM="Thalassiosira rotula, Strain GSO102" /LENGTH=1315 /DNA_ID=CAMNT_0041423787 /DNA_START=50 /DNA_END=3998 /DNA_ORIENTATION=-